MTKQQYVKQLKDKGYEAEVKDGIIMVYVDELGEDIEDTKEKVKNDLGDYSGSFGIKFKQTKEEEVKI